jgi:hypothetical protein
MGLFNWRGGLGGRWGWSLEHWLALAGMGGGLAVQCPGVRNAWSLGGTRVSSGAETDAPVVQSHQHAGARPRGQRCNGQERECVYASGVLGQCGVRLLERK